MKTIVKPTTAHLTIAPLHTRTSQQYTPWRRFLWSLPLWLMVVIVFIPIAIIMLSWLHPQTDVWQHLIETQLSYLLKNTLVLFLGVGVWTLILGVSLAWLVAMCDFPGRRWFEWALILPLAIPAYVFAFVVLGLMDYSGPVQTLYREWFGHDAYFPYMRGTFGILFVMTSVLYPYVYMLARSAFVHQGRSALDTARLLGLGAWASFFRVALPMARPAIIAGLSLALMETLADFGAVSIFNFDTFTTAIYKSWFGLFNITAAAQLASLLLLFVALSLMAEQHFRRGKVHQQPFQHQRYVLQGMKSWLSTTYCFVIVLFTFIVPIVQLIIWIAESDTWLLDERFLQLVQNTLLIGVSAALIIVAIALAVVFGRRLLGRKQNSILLRTASMGYAFPGTVLAVGVMIPFAFIDREIWLPIAQFFNLESEQLLLGSFAGLLIAYTIRFFSVGLGPVSTSLERIKPVYQNIAQTLGVSQWALLKRVYIPLMSSGILTALLLVLVDIMKEMPATLLLRPFGSETLAVRIYELTSEGEWKSAALPSLALVSLSILPVIIMIRRGGIKSGVKANDKAIETIEDGAPALLGGVNNEPETRA
jgi:iron(III) transport system permease protein